MGLIEQATKDIQQILSNPDEFGISIKMAAPNGQIANIIGVHPKVHLGVSTEGNVISSKQARATFAERTVKFANSNYPLRNSDGNIDLEGHIFSMADSTGITKDYVVQTWIPDETIGIIVVMLGDYGQDN